MSDRQFLRQLLLAYLVKKASKSQPPDLPEDRPPKSKVIEALGVAIPAALGGGTSGFLGYRHGPRLAEEAAVRVTRKAYDYHDKLIRKIVGEHMNWPASEASRRNINELAQMVLDDPVLMARYMRREYPWRFRIPERALGFLAKRPGATAAITSLGGALAAGGLARLIQSLVGDRVEVPSNS